MRIHRTYPFLHAFIFSGCALVASTKLYEGFDMPTGVGKNLGSSEETRSGRSSKGWHSNWQVSKGKTQVSPEDLTIKGLQSTEGAILVKGERKERAIGQGIAIRQIGLGYQGNVFGSFRFRPGHLIQESALGLLLSLPGKESATPRSATFAICPKRWGSANGMVGAGQNKIVKNESGIECYPEETYLVLWKMKQLPKLGKRSNIGVKMWVLDSRQAAYYAAQGFSEAALDQAGEGSEADQVSQSMETSVPNSRRGIFRGMIISCFSVGMPRVFFDEICLSVKSLDEAAGRTSGKEKD